MEYDLYRKRHLQPMKKWVEGMDMTGVSISDADLGNGSPKDGDMIAMNPDNQADKWLVASKFFTENYIKAD